MKQQQFDIALELGHSFTVQQVEQLIKAELYCCDPQFDDEGKFVGCCGVVG